MFLVLGIDAATWKMITPNLDVLPALRRLSDIGKCRELILNEKPISPSVWCGMFCGKTPQEHRHEAFQVGGNLVRREDIKVDFIWDILHRQGKRVRALNVPFVVPPYSFNVHFKPAGFGLPTNEQEWHEELEAVTAQTRSLLVEEPDLVISVYTLLDRIQHFHWGESRVLEWYRRLDSRIGSLLFETGFIEGKNRLVVISDHGFCSFGEAKVQTLPRQAAAGEIKGDHDERAMLISVNVSCEITKPQDLFFCLRELV